MNGGLYELTLDPGPHEALRPLLVAFKNPLYETQISDFPQDWLDEICDEDDDLHPSQKAVTALLLLCVAVGVHLRLARVRLRVTEEMHLIEAVKLDRSFGILQENGMIAWATRSFGSALQLFAEALLERTAP